MLRDSRFGHDDVVMTSTVLMTALPHIWMSDQIIVLHMYPYIVVSWTR